MSLFYQDSVNSTFGLGYTLNASHSLGLIDLKNIQDRVVYSKTHQFMIEAMLALGKIDKHYASEDNRVRRRCSNALLRLCLLHSIFVFLPVLLDLCLSTCSRLADCSLLSMRSIEIAGVQCYTSLVGASWSNGVNIITRRPEGDETFFVLMSNPDDTNCVDIYDVVVPHLGFAQVNYDNPRLNYSDG